MMLAPVARPGDSWYVSQHEELWDRTVAPDRDAAILHGRESFCGEAFSIALGQPEGARRNLFDRDDLYVTIDGAHEDCAFEEAFSEEAGLEDGQIDELVDGLNAVWNAWIAKHRPCGNRLDLHAHERIPALPPEPQP